MSKKEVHNAIVTRVVDDDLGTALRGAVFFDAPSLFEGEFPLPAGPMFPYASANGSGMFWVPQVGDEIEVEIESDDGTFDTTDVELPEPRYRSMVYSDASDIDEKFKKNYPRRMGWKTASGHFLLFDDTNNERFISLTSSKGIELLLSDLKGDEKASLKTVSGHELLLDDTTKKISVVTSGGHQLLLDDLGSEIQLLHSSGALIKMTATKVEIIDASGSQKLTLEAGKSTLEAVAEGAIKSQLVKLGESPTFHATLAENVIGLHDTHTHTIVPLTGPTLIPTVPMSSKAGTPLDPTALKIFLQGNI